MGKINLLIANANQKFRHGEVALMKKAATAAEDFISSSFNFNYEVDVVVTVPSLLMSTIPEDGISGRTYSSNLIVLVLDTQLVDVNEDIVFETICHEMSHSLRWEKLDEYANTMFQGMILEGLAVALEEKAMIDRRRSSKEFFLNEILNTDQAMIDDIISQLKDNFNSESYNYDRVFYTGDAKLPRWAGYRLGYYIIRRHLDTEGMSIEELTLASYSVFKL